MRGIGAAARRGARLPSSYAAAFSSFSGIGGGGAGRGRGSGPSQFGQPPLAPGRPIPDEEGADPFSAPASVGVGRGRGDPAAPSSHANPPFSAFSGVGRGSPLPPPPAAEDAPRQDVAKGPEDASPASNPEIPSSGAFSSALPRPNPSAGAGRGMPRFQQPPADNAPEENRFIRRREPKKAAAPSSSAPSTQPKLSAQDAVKRALELLGGGEGADGGPGEGGRGGRGRGGRGGRGRGRGRARDEVDDRHMVHLGENADGEKLEKRLGGDKMKILEEAFEEAADNALPHPMEDAYMDACHTNNMVRAGLQWSLQNCQVWIVLMRLLIAFVPLFVQIEFEPEYHVNFDNPDVDEKPPMSLEEMLQKVKPFIVAYEGIKDQEEWEVIFFLQLTQYFVLQN
jgi:hypothetical protein